MITKPTYETPIAFSKLPATIHNLARAAIANHVNSDDFFYHDGCVGPFADGTNDCNDCQETAEAAALALDWAGLDDDAEEMRELLKQWRGEP